VGQPKREKRVVTVPLAYPFAWSTRPCQDVIDALRVFEKRSVESGKLEWGFTTAFPARRILDIIRPPLRDRLELHDRAVADAMRARSPSPARPDDGA
jgi:hypothetical protein